MSQPIPPTPQPAASAQQQQPYAQVPPPGYVQAGVPQAGFSAPQPQTSSSTGRATTLMHTNAYALVSVLTALVCSPLGIIFGHMALSQIKRNGDAGRGFALTGLIVGYVAVVSLVLFVVVYVGLIIALFAGFMSGFDSYGYDYYDDYYYDSY